MAKKGPQIVPKIQKVSLFETTLLVSQEVKLILGTLGTFLDMIPFFVKLLIIIIIGRVVIRLGLSLFVDIGKD